MFSRARNRDERRFQATRRDVARALILFRRTIAALHQAKDAGEDGVAVVEREIGIKQLDGVLPVIGAVADVADQDILVTAAERYSVLRRFSPRFLAAFDFRSNTPNDQVLAAIELLRAMDRDGTRILPKRDPGREPVAQQMAEPEHVIRCTGGVGVVLDDAQIGLVGMMVQAVEHVGRFAHRRRNDPQCGTVRNGQRRACRALRRGRCRIWR